MRALRDIVQSGALMPKNISRHAMVIRWPFWLDCTRRSNCCCESSRSLIARENRFSRNREKICELADGISVTRLSSFRFPYDESRKGQKVPSRYKRFVHIRVHENEIRSKILSSRIAVGSSYR